MIVSYAVHAGQAAELTDLLRWVQRDPVAWFKGLAVYIAVKRFKDGHVDVHGKAFVMARRPARERLCRACVILYSLYAIKQRLARQPASYGMAAPLVPHAGPAMALDSALKAALQVAAGSAVVTAGVVLAAHSAGMAAGMPAVAAAVADAAGAQEPRVWWQEMRKAAEQALNHLETVAPECLVKRRTKAALGYTGILQWLRACFHPRMIASPCSMPASWLR